MTPLILRPADGRRVRKPDGSLLAVTGETVTSDAFWQRRLKDGDVVPVAPVTPVEAAPLKETV